MGRVKGENIVKETTQYAAARPVGIFACVDPVAGYGSVSERNQVRDSVWVVEAGVGDIELRDERSPIVCLQNFDFQPFTISRLIST
jgi:hypothetical protein